MKLHRIGVLSQAKVFAVIYSGFGVLIGLVWAGRFAVRQLGAFDGVHAAIEAVAAAIIAPFAFALWGFIAGAFAAVLFNVAATITGGLEIEIVQEGAHLGQ